MPTPNSRNPHALTKLSVNPARYIHVTNSMCFFGSLQIKKLYYALLLPPNHEKKKERTDPWALLRTDKQNQQQIKQTTQAKPSKAKAPKDTHTNHNDEWPTPPPPLTKTRNTKFVRRRNQEKLKLPREERQS